VPFIQPIIPSRPHVLECCHDSNAVVASRRGADVSAFAMMRKLSYRNSTVVYHTKTPLRWRTFNQIPIFSVGTARLACDPFNCNRVSNTGEKGVGPGWLVGEASSENARNVVHTVKLLMFGEHIG